MRFHHAVPGLAAAALLAAAPAQAAPPGGGLIDDHVSSCTDLGVVTMTLTRGSTFWIGDTHYLVTHVEYPGSGYPSLSFGLKTGLGSDTITCSGVVDGVAIVSTDVAIR